MKYQDTSDFLRVVCGFGVLDVNKALGFANEWDIALEDVIENLQELDINPLKDDDNDFINYIYYEIFYLHAIDIKEAIKDSLEDYVSLKSEEDYELLKEAIDDYEVSIITNCMASSYNENYYFWDYTTSELYKEEGIKLWLKELINEYENIEEE